MAITRAPRVITLRVNPTSLMAISAAKSDIGIELPTMALALKSPKKINSVSIESSTPMTRVSATDLRESLMVSAESLVISRRTSGSDIIS